jgi:phosphoglycolate phosphatase-like HAD superfamily hydrolase
MSTDEPSGSFDTAVLDLDGTLVDSVYQHVVAWRSAFLTVGLDVPAARIHRAVGMGGDRLVTEVAGRSAEAAVGDEVRAVHGERFEALIPHVTATEGALELIEALRHHHLKVVVASSGEQEQTERLLTLLDAGQSLDDWVSGPEVNASKPAPDLLDAALDRVDGDAAVVIGDAVWDVATAQERKLPCIGLLTGGISEAELRDAGASAVFASPAELTKDLERTLADLAASR